MSVGLHKCAGVYKCSLLCAAMPGCKQVSICVCMCVWDEFSEYLLETRFLTSANYDTHPLRIFLDVLHIFKKNSKRTLFLSHIATCAYITYCTILTFSAHCACDIRLKRSMEHSLLAILSTSELRNSQFCHSIQRHQKLF